MNEKIEIGKYNILQIDRDSDHGLHLISQDEETSVLLPNIYVSNDMQIGNEIKVFVYTDSEDRPIATTLTPKAVVGEFALLKVIDQNKIGAFLDWGLAKDLFVPLNQQKRGMLKVGKKFIFRVALDKESNRVYASQKVGQFLDNDTKYLKINDKVNLLVLAKTPLGFKVIVNDRHEGMLFNNEIFEDLFTGNRRKGYIKKIRDDGKLDISLQPIGKQSIDLAEDKIITLLDENGGILPYNYKTEPEIIKKVFGLSKKAYKRVLTQLIDKKIIIIEDSNIKKL